MRLVWCAVQQRFVERHQKVRPPVARSALPSPMIISDQLDGVLSHADGRVYDSKSAYYAAVRAAGCEIVGNERMPEPQERYSPAGLKQDIATAIDQLEAGYHPPMATGEATL